jgi:hypothetical protein
VAEAFQNFDHADARARKQRVHEAGDEKRDGHSIARHIVHATSGSVIKKIL